MYFEVYFLPSERLIIFVVCFLNNSGRMFWIRRLVGARHVSPAVLWTLWPEGGSEPLTGAPRSDFMTLSLFLSIDVCRRPAISPLRIEKLAEFFSGRSWPKIRPGFWIEFGTFAWSFGLKARAVQKSYGGYLRNSNFFWQHRVSISIGLRSRISSKLMFASCVFRVWYIEQIKCPMCIYIWIPPTWSGVSV